MCVCLCVCVCVCVYSVVYKDRSTVRKLTPSKAAVLPRGFLIDIIILPALFSISKYFLTL